MVKYSSLHSKYASDHPRLILFACVFIFSITSFVNLKNIRENEIKPPSLNIEENNFNWKNWLEKNNIDYVLPIYQQVTSEIWIYHCLGLLIHPKAILTAEECIQAYESYATGIFKWKPNFNATVLDNNKLFKISSSKGRFSHRLTTFEYLNEKNVKWIGKNTVSGIIIMSIDDPINFINPVNLSESLALNDIYDGKLAKKCVHLIFSEIGESGEHFPKQILENIIPRSELFSRFNKTYEYLYNLHKNIFIEFNNEVNIFGTIDKLNLKSYDTQRGLLGSPILCKRQFGNSSSYSLAGLLTSQLHGGFYEYSGLNQGKEWIKERLSYIQ